MSTILILSLILIGFVVWCVYGMIQWVKFESLVKAAKENKKWFRVSVVFFLCGPALWLINVLGVISKLKDVTILWLLQEDPTPPEPEDIRKNIMNMETPDERE